MDFSFSIDKILKVLKRFFLLMIVFAIVFYALGYYLTKRTKSVSYYSYTELYIHTIATDSNEYVKYIETEAKYVDTYLLTIDTYKFYEELRGKLPEQWKDKVTSGYLKGCVSATKRSDSAIIRFTVYTYSSELTLAITQTLSTYMDDYLWNNYSVKSVQTVEEPRPPVESVSQNKFLSLAMAVLGALIAFGFGYVKVMQDRRIAVSNDLEQYEVPILGVIPSFDSSENKKGGKYAYSGYSSYSGASNRIEENGQKSPQKKKK